MAERDIPEDFQVLVDGKRPELCHVSYCRNVHLPQRRLCSKHKMARWRYANPLRASFSTLRDHARARKLAFSLTFEQFRDLVTPTAYLADKGNTKDALQLDRVDASRGYHADNMEVITTSENTSKGNTERQGAAYKAALLKRKGYKTPVENDPF